MSSPTSESPRSEITPEWLYLSRRKFVRQVGLAAAGATVLAACAPDAGDAPAGTPGPGPTALQPGSVSVTTDELGDSLTPFEDVTTYNNYYEFSTDKDGPSRLAQGFATEPWSVEVGGLVEHPQSFTVEDLRRFGEEERVYRLRCVEGWSMVIPWLGFPLSRLLESVEPRPEAKFVRFEAIHDPARLPGQSSPWYQWPYVEGLRLDEAMNDLAILATGLYGKALPPQNGSPIRLVVPWKYGFKSIKAIVRIDLVVEQPTTLWMAAAPSEYGFYSNVNPDVDHPRWSQATERRIGEFRRRETLLFNGYADQVAHLYEGMDLRVNF
jgi:sulfoxide reductase catalytic subunit YedY